MNHNVDRRTLIQALAAFGPMTMAGHVWAAPKTDARLLVVFLRGAYDAANVVIPIGSDFYYQSRPALAVPRPGSHAGKPGPEAIVLDFDWGLHPALHDPILPLWQRKQIAFVPFAGTDDLTRSHFETQDTIELGQPINGSRNYQSGFHGTAVRCPEPRATDRLYRSIDSHFPWRGYTLTQHWAQQHRKARAR